MKHKSPIVSLSEYMKGKSNALSQRYQQYKQSHNSYSHSLNKKYVIKNKPKNKNTISLYPAKEKIEQIFAERMRHLIISDEAAKKNFEEISSSPSKDKWKPEGYIYYDYLRKHPLFVSSDFLTTKHDREFNSVLKKPFNAKFEDERANMNGYTNYNYLFRNRKTLENMNNNEKKNYDESDVFNRKQEPNTLLRSGETYLFYPNKAHQFTPVTESRSEWLPKTSKKPSLNNYTSVGYNIISPTNRTTFLTKDDVDKVSPQYYKVNSVSQYVDINRVTAPNHTLKYLETFNKDPNCFRYKNDIASNYEDMHKTYKEICTKPFERDEHF